MQLVLYIHRMVPYIHLDTNKIHHLYDLIRYMLTHFDKVTENKMFVEDIHTNDLNIPVDTNIDHRHRTTGHMYL